jgi:hypothetical protein
MHNILFCVMFAEQEACLRTHLLYVHKNWPTPEIVEYRNLCGSVLMQTCIIFRAFCSTKMTYFGSDFILGSI